MMNPQEAIPLALRAAYLVLHRQSDAAFSEHGVTADQFVLLATLAKGEALTQRELALRMPSDPSTVRAMLVLLEERGLVRRGPHPTDGRARTAALTAAGHRMFRELWDAGESIRTQAVSELTVDDAGALVRILRQVTRSLTALPTTGSRISTNGRERVS
ncbi:MAG: MarR family transcriptional regulator [Planctomycetaceae bacterium]|nr:MarR family transcriptional regulator [Planctomycetaceae bacterium]